MSYDLYLDRSTPVTPNEFHAFYSQRPMFRAENGQAVYENEDTGVYFIFNLATPDDSEEPSHKVSFNLNYFRPHFFAREAASELATVISTFGFGIHDPQNDGMGDGPFSEEGFLRGWDHGNAFGYRALLRSETPPTVHSRPTAELDAIWSWNRQKASLQDELGEEVFVPRVFWVVANGKLSSAVVWPDGIPELLPSVDLYFIGRDQLAPRRFFRRGKDTCIVSRSELEQALGPMTAGQHSLASRLFKEKAELADVRRFVTNLQRTDVKTTGIPMDQVLNQELIDQV